MAGFCASCGAALSAGSRFCPKCGGPVLTTTAAPIEADPATPLSTIPLKVKLAGLGLFAIAVIGALAWSMGGSGGDAPADTATAAASESARRQEWFDNYKDTFVSAEVERLVTGTAQKRNFPTALGSKVIGSVKAGDLLTGRLVQGGDASAKWLKTADGGYVWDGNLAAPDAITSRRVNRFPVDVPFSQIASDFSATGRYSGQDSSWDIAACEIYQSNDGKVGAMVIDGTVVRYETGDTSLSTANGIRVGSTEADLTRAYGKGKLKREDNPYAGVDYFYWATKDRGIKFNVEAGKVTYITAGGSAIAYVEGCL